MARGPGTAPLKQSQGEELGGLTQERWEIGLSMLKKKKKGLEVERRVLAHLKQCFGKKEKRLPSPHNLLNPSSPRIHVLNGCAGS